jgi:hypothetical protein
METQTTRATSLARQIQGRIGIAAVAARVTLCSYSWKHMTNPPKSFLALLAVITPTLANADQDTATACSNGLSADGKLVYGKVAPSVTPKTDLKEALTSAVRPLVVNGRMKREQARLAAEEAGECLKLLK